MRQGLALMCVFWACAQPATRRPITPQVGDDPVVAQVDSLTSADRAKIVEAIAIFRQLIFSNDTTTRLEGCSVALAVGPDYRALIRRDLRRLVSEPTTACGTTPDLSGYTRRLVLRSITGGSGEATATVIFRGGSYTHDEEYKLKMILPPTGRDWVTKEVRVSGM